LLIYCTNDNTNNIQIQVEEGQTATTYQAPVKTTDLSESLGQTVYGGRLLPRTGKVYSKFRKDTLGWGTDYVESTTMGDTIRRRFTLTGAQISNLADRANAVCDSAPYLADYTSDTVHFYVSSDRSIYIFLPVGTDESTQVDVCCVLTNAVEIQLTPHEIALSQGYNYISTNGTSISLAYHNGELATHADVEQLGETVNELGEYVDNIGSVKNITNRVTRTDKTTSGTLMVRQAGKMVSVLLSGVLAANAGDSQIILSGLPKAAIQTGGIIAGSSSTNCATINSCGAACWIGGSSTDLKAHFPSGITNLVLWIYITYMSE